MEDIKIFAVIGSSSHTNETINSGNALFIQAKEEKEQQSLVREVALAVRGDTVKLSNGLYLVITADR
ncbi:MULTISPECIES: hypothetical protein [Niallia]|uniref:capping complex subunit for YIEGIA n=1 Tax=Niallia TaxID=2837506 RepID=UPI0015F73482|nr:MULTISPECIES: hypothetical protein [Niallia]UPO91194.1 hypothetical protein L8T27_028195 [Niallia sp. Man26]GKU84185.1 hypothetical protein NCCP28_35810 [Niallia sp. NCCP-28]